jgi:hypothetical protein
MFFAIGRSPREMYFLTQLRKVEARIYAVLSSPVGSADLITETPIRHAVSFAETVSKSALDPAYVLTILVVAYIFSAARYSSSDRLACSSAKRNASLFFMYCNACLFQFLFGENFQQGQAAGTQNRKNRCSKTQVRQ